MADITDFSFKRLTLPYPYSMSVQRIERIDASAGVERIMEVFRRDGGVIIGGFLTGDQVSRFNKEVQPALDKLAAGKVSEQLEIAEGGDFMGKNTKRLMNVTAASEVFRQEIIENELFHQLCEKVFCDRRNTGYWFNTTQIIEIGPGNPAQPLHRDQELYPIWNRLGPDAPEATVNFLTALSPFTDRNGATRVVPNSASWQTFQDTFTEGGFYDHAKEHETIPAEMETDDCIFFSGKLLHGGGWNRTSDEYRRGIALSVVRTGLMPENANPMLLPLDVVDTMSYRAQAMLGFRSLWPINHGLTGSFWTSDYNELGRTLGLKDKEKGMTAQTIKA